MEEYLEAIYVLEAEGDAVIAARLADYLGVARPTVTQTMQRMTASGFVAAGEGRSILLTEAGRERAERIVRRHRLLERWLTDELGLDWADAHVEAGRLEHSVSPLVEERLFERLGRPTTCPHGNVIPGSGARQPHGIPLRSVSVPAVVTVLCIVEQAEEDLALLRFLHKYGVVPGARIDVAEQSSPFEAGIPITVAGERIAITPDVAARILVVPE